MTKAFVAEDRAVLSVTGGDAERFLQDLITSDLSRAKEGCVYAALLSPQGKYLFDFFVYPTEGGHLLDVAADRAQALAQRLAMYRLRAKVDITASPLKVVLGQGELPESAVPDPRSAALGWRMLTEAPEASGWSRAEYDAIRVADSVPETGIELIPEESYILEAGFERLNGVDFRKGCYVGQEVTARMKHKTELRKGLVRVSVEGETNGPGSEITVGDKTAGTLFTRAGDEAIAHLRFDRAEGEMHCGEAVVRRV